MNRRTGATLVEVLVTIFVMALGLIALLTLFPIGALRMAEAIKDSRTALAAANAEAIATARNLRNDNLVVPHYSTFTVQSVPATPPMSAQPDGPSFPVYMDPVGFSSYSGLPSYLRDYVGGATRPTGIRRVSANFIGLGSPSSLVRIQRTLGSFSLLDDITFGPDGVPIRASDGQPTNGPGQVQREGRYSWGLMFKRPKTATPSVVDLTVVVYSGRPQQFQGLTGVPATVGETPYQASNGAAGGNSLVVRWDPASGEERPNIKKGTWVLDATSYDLRLPQPGLRQLALRNGPVHGHFYRVVNVASEAAMWMELQLETPLKADIYANAPAPPGQLPQQPGYSPRIIVMEHVSEVFEKGPGWLP